MEQTTLSQARTPEGVPQWATARRSSGTADGGTPLEFGADRDRGDV